MTKICDNKSIGMLVWKNEKLLLIERARPPFGFAPPAGHVDDFGSFEEAAKQELKEEVGLDAMDIKLIGEGRKENQCRRKGGSWHYWKIYKVIADGVVERSMNETKQAGFYTKDDISKLAERTKQYVTGDIDEEEWKDNPGIEPVWAEWLEELVVLS